VLVAAVAAGAVLPAIQTLGTHVADAEAPRAAAPEPATAALTLASEHRVSGAAGAAVASVSPVTLPATAARTVSSSSSSDDAPSAGDDADVSALLKAMEVERENGPLEFGRPYEAGNERTLDGQIAKALGLMGLPQRLAPGVKKIIMRESTGNADAVNDWDSNAASGTPSKGLMQLIDTTFRNAVLPELADRGIFDPVANITAGVRTMIANHSIDDVLAGGLRNSSGDYIGYGGAAIPDDGLGLAD
jgi:soluble lytic murein transglycosylase-like protein